MKKHIFLSGLLITTFALLFGGHQTEAKTSKPKDVTSIVLGQTYINPSSLKKNVSSAYHVVNPTILSIDENGIIRALHTGTTEVLTFAGSEMQTRTYQVIGLSPCNPVMKVGEELTLSIKGFGRSAIKGSWFSSDPGIVGVDSKGKIRAKSAGHATISYTLPNQTSLTAEVCVNGHQIAAPKDVYLGVGTRKNLNTSQINNQPGQKLRWSTASEEIAVVSQNGTVTGLKAGETTIVCSAGTKQYSYKVHVFGMESHLLAGTRQSYELNLENVNESVTWSSSDSNVVSVSGDRDHATITTKESTGSAIITAKVQDITLSCKVDVAQFGTQVLFMKKGQSYTLNKKNLPVTKELSWHTSNANVAKIDASGKITAKGAGHTTISCTFKDNTSTACSLSMEVNVLGKSYTGNQTTFTYVTADGRERTYTLYKQNAHNYSNYNRYLAWHGCATCSLTTVLNGYANTYANADPPEITDGIERIVCGEDAWTKQHEVHDLPHQMPLSLHGISTILSKCDVKNNYVRTYKEQEAAKDIIAHLKTGNPIIFEVRQKSNLTGKKSKRWTNSYHTMVMLGYLANGKILLCDSVDRSWYHGDGQRLKIVELEDLMEFMFPCTSDDKPMYYSGASSDGGYIKIYDQ